ncbi:MAG: gluconate 2-dehydrogenase subunit 3 family protein [Bryobacteraceae bacterium]
MKRRTLIRSALGASAASALPVPLLPQAPRPAEETPALATASPDGVASAAPRFFSAQELAALRRLGDILAPAQSATPGAVEAGAAEFLDFLISESPPGRQTLYRAGVRRLNQEARTRYGKPFAEITAPQAEAILAPLGAAWTYHGPSDAFARFLLSAKDDFIQATMNSREFVTAVSGRSRQGGGTGVYWLPIE